MMASSKFSHIMFSPMQCSIVHITTSPFLILETFNFQLFCSFFLSNFVFPIVLPIDLLKDVGWHFADQPWPNKWGFGQAGHIFIWERQRFVPTRSRDLFLTAKPYFHQGYVQRCVFVSENIIFHFLNFDQGCEWKFCITFFQNSLKFKNESF